MINFLGVSIVVFGWIVTYVVTKEDYKRQDHSEYSPSLND